MPRPPQPDDVREQCQHIAGKICLHRLAEWTSAESFRSYCSQWGHVKESNITTHHRLGYRFGFVTFDRPDCAIAFLDEDFHILDEQRVLATAAVPVKRCFFRGIFFFKLGCISNNALYEYLQEHCGPMSSFSRPCDNQGRKKDFAFVHFAKRNTAEKSLLMMHKIGHQNFSAVRLRVDKGHVEQDNVAPQRTETNSLDLAAPAFVPSQGTKIYISKLDSGVSKNALIAYCENWGKVVGCNIKEREPYYSRYAFVTFATADSAQIFLQHASHSLGGRRLRASAAGIPSRGVGSLGKMIAVKCLRRHTSVDSLQDFFSQYGKIIVAFKKSVYGWVLFESHTSAEKALLSTTRDYVVSRAVHGDVSAKVQVWNRVPKKGLPQDQPPHYTQLAFAAQDWFSFGWVATDSSGGIGMCQEVLS